MSTLKNVVIGTAIAASVYYSGKIRYNYKVMKNAIVEFSAVNKEKAEIYNRVTKIDELTPIVKDDVREKYVTERSSLLEKAVKLDKTFLDVAEKLEKQQNNAVYSWGAFFK